jgi:multiple sugar transport system permease protein
VMPGVIIALIWNFMLQADLGVVNQMLQALGWIDKPIVWFNEQLAMESVIVANTWKAFPFWLIMLLAGLQSISRDQIEAARIDGANRSRLIWHIKLPGLRPIFAATGVLTTIWTLNYFDLIYVMTKGGPGIATSTFPVYTYNLGFQMFRFGEAATMSIISMVLIFMLCIPYIRMMINNLKG